MSVMLRDPQALRRVISEYGRLRRLEGCTPQARGQRFNALIADALKCWGIDAIPNVLSAGEVDVVFAIDGVRYILEAKWEKDRTDTGKVAKLQKRVRQRLAGTYGVMLSMSGYTPAALDDVKDGERLEVLLLDGDHWEALLAGMIPPDELFSLVRDHAAFRGRPYTPVPELFSTARIPHLSFDPPPTLPDGGLAAAQPGVKAEVVLSRITSGQLGIAPAGPDRLLVTTEDAVIRVDLRDRTAEVAVPMTRCRRNPLISQDGSILFLRANGIGRYHDGRFTTVGGALTGNCCLVANPDGSTWVFDNGADADPGASVTKLGASLGDPETRLPLSYPPMSAFTAAWVTAGELLTIGNPDFRITSVPGGSQRTHRSPQTNPMGIVRLDSGTVLTAGDSVTLVRTDTESWESTEVARLAVSPSVNELARDRDGTVYLASYYPTAEPGLTFAVIRLTGLNRDGNSRQ